MKSSHLSDAPKQSRWSKKRKILLLVLVLLLVIGLAIGLGVGLTRGGNSSSGEEEPPSPTVTLLPTSGNVWQPAIGDSWQIVLQNPLQLETAATSVTPDVAIFDIDLFTNPKSTIDTLHRLGKRVICYFSAGSFEPNRPDSDDFKGEDMGGELDGWPGEKWLMLSSPNVRSIMAKRLELAAKKGCDAVDPDNVDGYSNTENDLDLTADDTVSFLTFLTSQASSLNMSIGLKNAAAVIPAVLPAVQFSVNEQCVAYGECSRFSSFVDAKKPVFHIEYPTDIPNIKMNVRQDICTPQGDAQGSDAFSTVLKKMDLDGWVQFCDGQTANTMVTQSPS